MSEPTERVAAACPACSPDAPTAHEVLKPGGQATVRCTECDHVHKTTLDDESAVERRVIVSQDGDSFEARVEAPPTEEVEVGEEFLLETEAAIMTVRVTSLEVGDEERADEARVEDVRTFWTRAVGNVAVDLTLHPKAGAGSNNDTRSVEIHVPGDEEFVVGETTEYGDEEFSVEGIMLREDASGYDFEKLDHDGDAAVAKDVKRVYARDESTTAWSAW